jgi:hypothetical protein
MRRRGAAAGNATHMNEAMRAVTNAVQGACEGLLTNYRRYVTAALASDSPDPEDDEWVKLGIAAFSSFSTTERWAREDFECFAEMRAAEFVPEVVEAFGDEALAHERFGCLCIGAILGLRRLGAVKNDDELTVAHGTAMAFMSFRSREIGQLERP